MGMTREEREKWQRHPQFKAVEELLRYPMAHFTPMAEAGLCTWYLKVNGTLK